MEDRKKSYYLILLMPILYVLFAYGMARILENSRSYLDGINTLSHLYKGDLLYQAICKGDFWPIYDPLWYNGVEALRYWEPLPVYILAICQFFAVGNSINGFLVFVMFIFFVGAVSWFYVGLKVNRPYFGAFLGVLWFFMPNHLVTLFYEGNLPRSICIAILPFLMYWIYNYFQFGHWYNLPKISLCFALMALCQSEYAGGVFLAILIYLFINAVIVHKWDRGWQVLFALFLGYMLIGVWLIPSLMDRITSINRLEIMSQFFQSIFLSINPFARFEKGNVDFYFGLAAFLLAVFGSLLSKKKSMPGFWTGIIILIASSNTLYLLLKKLPGGQYLPMLCFISIALCMILFSFLIWDTLKKGWILFFITLLLLDVLPSFPLILGEQSRKIPQEIMEGYSDWTFIDQAKELTEQRLALIDENALDARSVYLVTGYGKPVATSYGAVLQSCTTATNMKQIDHSLKEGNYLYLFDRCLEMGNDTIVIRLALVKDFIKHPIQEMDQAASRVGYKLVDYNEEYRFYKLEVEGNWGTLSKYRAIGIGTEAPEISRQFPIVEETDTTNLNDFTFEELCEYDLIYLAGFTYKDKSVAEELILKLSEAGVHIILAADGIPEDRGSKNQSFLGVICNTISFSQGYPNLKTIDGILETDLFPDGHREWSTVYVNGLDKVWGTIENGKWNLPFYGTVKNNNIIVIGLNLTYYYALTQDKGVGALLSHAMNLNSSELPKREIVPYTIQYFPENIIITTNKKDVNTALAYHNSFSANREIYSKNHLTYVKEGKTIISLTYPYLKQGILVSITAAFLILGYSLHMWLRRKI